MKRCVEHLVDGAREPTPKDEPVRVCRDLLGAEFVVGDHDAVVAAVAAWEAGEGDLAEYLFAAQARAARPHEDVVRSRLARSQGDRTTIASTCRPWHLRWRRGGKTCGGPSALPQRSLR